jgi:hypothetical protein
VDAVERQVQEVATLEEARQLIGTLGAEPHRLARETEALLRYLEKGRLAIDNGGAERAVNPLVLGRKNRLFCGSEPAARRAAVLLSLVRTCERLEIDPFTQCDGGQICSISDR